MNARAAAMAAMVIALSACAPAVGPVTETAPPPVWPAEPAPPRIAYVRAFSQPADLGIGKGLLERLGEIVFGAAESRLVRPMAVVVVERTIFVADPGAKGVHRFDGARARYDLLRVEGGAPLLSPVALARGAEGAVYATDSALAKVFVLRPGAGAFTPLPLKAVLRQPTGIAHDAATGRLYVTDTSTHQVHAFERDGTLAFSVGGRGTGNGEFNYPTLIWCGADGRLYVNDSLNSRIQIFDRSGRHLSSFGRAGDGTGDLARPKGLATDAHGHVYVVDALFHAIQIFDASGRFLLSVGTHGRERGEFWLPAGIFSDSDGTLYVADSYNRRVQVLRYIGGAT
jgi:DNA-binding beta-propeller fold protein YncE